MICKIFLHWKHFRSLFISCIITLWRSRHGDGDHLVAERAVDVLAAALYNTVVFFLNFLGMLSIYLYIWSWHFIIFSGIFFLCFRILSTCSGCGLGYPKLFGSFRISNWVRFAMYSFIVFPFWSLCDDSCRDLINFLGQIGGRLQGQKTLLAFVVNTRPAIGDPYKDGHFFLS